MRLLDKVAIVTGSTSGIGRATAERFAREGAHVLVTGRSKDEAEAVASALNDTALRDGTGEAAFVAADASSSEGVREVVAAAVQRWGRVDLLVNNAAMMTFDPISDLEEEDWDKVLAVNLRGPFLLRNTACLT